MIGSSKCGRVFDHRDTEDTENKNISVSSVLQW